MTNEEREQHIKALEEDIANAQTAFDIDYGVLKQAIKDCDADLAKIEEFKLAYKEFCNDK